MLTYATLGEFKRIKQIAHLVSKEGDSNILSYLQRATDYIDRYTHRQFFPWRETREFAIPNEFLDLRRRRLLTADLNMDADLLEVESMMTASGDELTEGTHFFTLPPNITPKAFIALKSPSTWSGANLSNSLSSNFSEPVLNVTAIWGYHEGYTRGRAWIDSLDTIKTTALTNLPSNDTIIVNDADGTDSYGLLRFEQGTLLKIDDEMMIVKSAPNTSNNTVKVIRAAQGTEIAAHDVGTIINKWRVTGDIVEATIQVAKTYRESDVAAGGRLGVSDISAGVEISIPADPLNIIKSYVRSIF